MNYKFLIIPILLVSVPTIISIAIVGFVNQKKYNNTIITNCTYAGYKIIKQKCNCQEDYDYCPVQRLKNLKNLNRCDCVSGGYTGYVKVFYKDYKDNIHIASDKYTCGKNISDVKLSLNNVPKKIRCWYIKDKPEDINFYYGPVKSGINYIIAVCILVFLLLTFIFIWLYKYGRRIITTSVQYRQIPTIVNSSLNYTA